MHICSKKDVNKLNKQVIKYVFQNVFETKLHKLTYVFCFG